MTDIIDLNYEKVKVGDFLFYSEILPTDKEPEKYNFFTDYKDKLWEYTYADSILEVIEQDGILYTKALVIRDLEDNLIEYQDEKPIELEYGLEGFVGNYLSNKLSDSFIISIPEGLSPLDYLKDNEVKLLNQMADIKRRNK